MLCLDYEAAHHTFVFFIQGASDHYVPQDLNHPKKKWVHADAYDAKIITKQLKKSKLVNGVILHIKHGKSSWKNPRAFIKIYARITKISTYPCPDINGADPLTLTNLIKRAAAFFPKSNLHLIYRGHGFDMAYDPLKHKNLIRPFDSNFSDWPYDREIFKQSIKDANVAHLKSLSLAACTMKTKNVFERLSELNIALIASERAIIESPVSHGFSYEFLSLVTDADSAEDVTQLIDLTLFKAPAVGP